MGGMDRAGRSSLLDQAVVVPLLYWATVIFLWENAGTVVLLDGDDGDGDGSVAGSHAA